MAKPVNELTPMQRQYNDIKAANQDCILFFRLGDFYEMFNEDAKLAARELDLQRHFYPRSHGPLPLRQWSVPE